MRTRLILALTLYVPTALVVERFPEPAYWSLCHGGCPDNQTAIGATHRSRGA